MKWKQIDIKQGDSVCFTQTTACSIDGGVMVKVISYTEWTDENDTEINPVAENVIFLPGYTLETNNDSTRIVKIRA